MVRSSPPSCNGQNLRRRRECLHSQDPISDLIYSILKKDTRMGSPLPAALKTCAILSVFTHNTPLLFFTAAVSVLNDSILITVFIVGTVGFSPTNIFNHFRKIQEIHSSLKLKSFPRYDREN